MRRAAILTLLALPLAASTYTATSSSENGGSCSHLNQPSPTTCTSSSSSAGGAGTVTSFAGFISGDSIALAYVDLTAACFTIVDCLAQHGFAETELDLAIHGPTGASGLIEINAIAFSTDGTASTTVAGLTVSSPFGPHFGVVYNFLYGQPFHISAMVNASCSECGPDHNTARVIAPFYVYDLNMNLIETITSPLDATVSPEPSSFALLVLGCLLGLAKRTLTARSRPRASGQAG